MHKSFVWADFGGYFRDVTEARIERLQKMSREELLDRVIRSETENEYLRKAIYGARSERHVPAEIAEQMKLELGEIGKAEDPPETETMKKRVEAALVLRAEKAS